MLVSTPTRGRNELQFSSMNAATSATTRPPGTLAGGSMASIKGMLPRLPPQNVGRPEAWHSAPVSAVVVDLPLVPVIAISVAPGSSKRYVSSISAITSTPAARAATIAGKVGTPGDITTRSAVV